MPLASKKTHCIKVPEDTAIVHSYLFFAPLSNSTKSDVTKKGIPHVTALKILSNAYNNIENKTGVPWTAEFCRGKVSSLDFRRSKTILFCGISNQMET